MRLIGFADGVEVSFDYDPPLTFKAYIPKTINGRHVLHLKVIDDYGNIDSYTGLYVYLDIKNMTFKILDSNFQVSKNETDYSYKEIKELYVSEQLCDKYHFKRVKEKFTYKELV